MCAGRHPREPQPCPAARKIVAFRDWIDLGILAHSRPEPMTHPPVTAAAEDSPARRGGRAGWGMHRLPVSRSQPPWAGGLCASGIHGDSPRARGICLLPASKAHPPWVGGFVCFLHRRRVRRGSSACPRPLSGAPPPWVAGFVRFLHPERIRRTPRGCPRPASRPPTAPRRATGGFVCFRRIAPDRSRPPLGAAGPTLPCSRREQAGGNGHAPLRRHPHHRRDACAGGALRGLPARPASAPT